MSDVNELFKNNLEVKKKPRGYNSFVASNNNHTYQIGICFPQKFRGGLVATDVLSIYAVVVPIESKEIPDVIAGTMEALQKMGKKPQIIYTDDEGAVTSNDFRQYVEDEGIVLYRTRGHPEFAERFASSSHTACPGVY